MLKFEKVIHMTDTMRINVRTGVYKGEEHLDIRCDFFSHKTGQWSDGSRAGVRFYFDREAVMDGDGFSQIEAFQIAMAEFEQAFLEYLKERNGV